jgi:hypothetical protein
MDRIVHKNKFCHRLPLQTSLNTRVLIEDALELTETCVDSELVSIFKGAAVVAPPISSML